MRLSRNSFIAVLWHCLLLVAIDAVLQKADAADTHPMSGVRYCLGPVRQSQKLENGADLSGLDLRNMTLYGDGHYYSNVNFNDSILSGADLNGGDTLYTRFSKCSFRKAAMRRIIADGVIVRDCDLTDADISGSRIELDADQLRSTWNYKAKDLSDTCTPMLGYLRGFNFAGFKLRNSDFLGSHSTSALFVAADFTGADISGARIRLTADQLRSTQNYRRRDLRGVTLIGDFSGMSFRGFDLRHATFLHCRLRGCDLNGAEINGMAVVGTGHETKEPGDWKTTFDPSASTLTKEQLYATASYRRRDLDHTFFYGCDFAGAEFSRQTLGLFKECNVREADFSNADFIAGPGEESQRETLRAWPDGVGGIGFDGCSMSFDQFSSLRAYKSRRLPCALRLSHMNLTGWDFSDCDLRFVVFDCSNLANAKLANARGGDLQHAAGMTVRQVMSMWNYQGGKIDRDFGFALPDVLLKEMEPTRDAVRPRKQ